MIILKEIIIYLQLNIISKEIIIYSIKKKNLKIYFYD